MLLAVYFTLALAASGYAFVDSDDRSPWTPSAACLGFVLCGLIITISWWLGFTSVPGMHAFSFLAFSFGVHRMRAGLGPSASYVVEIPAALLCFAATALVAVEFYPLFSDGGTVNELPQIFDLPKHISALGACVRTTRFPVENPWVPNADFAYQTSFYAPFAAIAAAIGTSAAIVKLSAAMPVVATFLILATIAAAGSRLGLSRVSIISSILMASIVGGHIQALAAPGLALGATLAAKGRLGGLPWFEDPFTYFIYIPNHIFSAACILAAWLEATKPAVRPAGMLRSGLLLAGAVQASGALIPHAVLAACLLALVHWWNQEGQADKARLNGSVSLLATFTITATPFLLAAFSWAQGPENVQFSFRFNLEGWMIQLLAIGPVAALLVLGMGMAWHRGGIWRSYVALFLPSMLFLCAIPHMEIAMKSAMTIRVLGVLAASLPVEWLVTQPKTTARRVLATGLVLVLCHACYFSSQTMIALLQSAYVKLDQPTASLVRSLQNLPFSDRVRISPPRQDLAALSGHNTFMDFTPIRRGGYLPFGQAEATRSSLDDLERLGVGTCPDSIRTIQASHAPFLVAGAAKRFLGSHTEYAEARDYILVPNSTAFECKAFKAVVPQLVDIGTEPWSAWPGMLPGMTIDAETLTLSSAQPVDAGFTRPVRLQAGRYRIRIQVSGTLKGPTSGAAHLSFHGKRKLIAIPPGDYKNKVFEAPFESTTSVSETLTFGLGGWATGAGTIRLETLAFSLLGTPD